MLDVVVEDPETEALEGRRDRADLREDVDAVAILGDHLLDAAHLALDPVQALDQSFLFGVVAVVGLLVYGRAHVAAPSLALRNRRRRKLLVTAKMLEAAIAAAAMIGFRRPAT